MLLQKNFLLFCRIDSELVCFDHDKIIYSFRYYFFINVLSFINLFTPVKHINISIFKNILSDSYHTLKGCDVSHLYFSKQKKAVFIRRQPFHLILDQYHESFFAASRIFVPNAPARRDLRSMPIPLLSPSDN